jgi:hypothetical protein
MTPTEVERAVTSTKKVGPPPAITEAFATLASSLQRRSLIGTWIGMSPGTNGKTKISFVWKPGAVLPGRASKRPRSVSLIAGNANADLYYRGRSLAPGRVEFEVPPGPIDLEIAVEDAEQEVIDRETRTDRRAWPGPWPYGEHAPGVSRGHAPRVPSADDESRRGAVDRA